MSWLRLFWCIIVILEVLPWLLQNEADNMNVVAEIDVDSLHPTHTEITQMRENVREMFHHAYDNYMNLAFPHDELKPLSGKYTDSLAELGNAKSKNKRDPYDGIAMTLIDSLSTLAIMGNKTEFTRGVNWIIQNIDFNLNIRVHVFEANIRLLGGLLSAHALAIDPDLDLIDNYYGYSPHYPLPLSLSSYLVS